MAAKKVNRAAEEFIANHRADMSVREIAAELGISRTTVQRVARKLGSYAEPETAIEASSAAVQVAGSDELVLLTALAAQLWSRIQQATNKDTPQLSREYRETLAKITALQAPSAQGAKEGEGDLFDAACAGIA